MIATGNPSESEVFVNSQELLLSAVNSYQRENCYDHENPNHSKNFLADLNDYPFVEYFNCTISGTLLQI